VPGTARDARDRAPEPRWVRDGRETLAHGEELFVALAAARAAELAGGADAYDAERAWQAAWLAERLALAA
jgi:hypothetical protein